MDSSATTMTSHPLTEGFSPADLEAIETRTRAIGQELFGQLNQAQPHVWQRRWWDDRIMSWAMRDEELKVELFRFVDVLPMLRGSEAVVTHLHEYLSTVKERLPTPLRVALGLTKRAPFTGAAVARAARLSAMDFARRFIAGTNAREVLDAASRERQAGRGFTLDILGETVTSRVESERYFKAYVQLLEAVAPTVNDWAVEPQLDHGVLGELPRVNLSVKLSALDSHFDAIDTGGAERRVGDRLRELLRVARGHKAFINVDMESYDKKDLTLRIFKSVLLEPEFRDVGDVGIVIQCYLRSYAKDLSQLCEWARNRGKPVWVRLVKGAYWDYETIHAQANGWPVPVFQQKWESDAAFEQATRFVMRNVDHLRPALGTHNLRSVAHGIAIAEHLGSPPNGFELQMLYGMADAEKQALVRRGHRLRIYMPYGELIPGMAYLVRRLLENTSNDSFLRAGVSGTVAPEKLLAKPQPDDTKKNPQPASQPMDATMTNSTTATFDNHPAVDFARTENRDAMQEALSHVLHQTGDHYPLVIGGANLATDDRLHSIDPSCNDRVVGECGSATAEHAAQAVAAARAAFPAWAARSAQQRGEFLRRAADGMQGRLFELAAWIVYESGKGWREATDDVCEAIDFCRFYANQAGALERKRGADVPGEENRFGYLPRGVAAVIAPWNFPLAILTGMTAAALATGNTVVMKPAEQTPVMGALLMHLFRDVDLPAGVLNYLPGSGEVVGAALVAHPDVALIAFTGSRDVGLSINRTAAEISAGQVTIVKRVIAEMGGKNAIIVDNDADLDEAVMGVVQSAFGYAGQKCSACSRVIVLRDVHDLFLERLVEATRSLRVGPAEEPSSDIGPVIDHVAQKRIFEYVNVGRAEAREVLSVDVGKLAEEGFYVGPHVFADVSPEARIAQEEIFGPLLAVIPAADLDEAFRIANGTDYALTGGIFSRSPANLERARREMMVGNLYLNRTITGALVGRQPFGGFRMSGIGSKAGSRDYLLQFVVPRTITENTMRRGFAPPTET